MKKILIFVLCLSSLYSFADQEAFLKLSDSEKVSFLNSSEVSALYHNEDINPYLESQPKIKEAIQKYAENLSNVWYDTILEGPYQLTGDNETEVVEIYKKDGEVYAILASVYAPAVLTEGPDDCVYNEESSTYENCEEGSISESFYIDFQGNLIESDNNYAEFN